MCSRNGPGAWTCSRTSKHDTISYASVGEAGSGRFSIDVFKYVNLPGADNIGSRLLCPSATLSTSGVGSIAVTESVFGRRAADSAKMPPPQPMSRYRSFWDDAAAVGSLERHCVMKLWRRGFMRWRRREGPWGSHQLDARALKCDTSVGSTVELVGLCCRALVNEKVRAVVAGAIRSVVLLEGMWHGGVCDRQPRNERNALAGVWGAIATLKL